jgi:2,3-bisphosphoglycerate-dependent phosphoglycerate mutase
MSRLILIRHGQSTWNELGQWTGLTNVDLTAKGEAEAQAAGEMVKQALAGQRLHSAYSSALKRAYRTAQLALAAAGQPDLEITQNPALNERDYGELTGKNKWEVKAEFGDDQFTAWRRSWDEPIPGGETLKDVYERVVPYYQSIIIKDLKANQNVLISSHGNTLRALTKYLDNLSETEVEKLEIGTGQAIVYDVNAEGRVVSKQVLTAGGNA